MAQTNTVTNLLHLIKYASVFTLAAVAAAVISYVFLQAQFSILAQFPPYTAPTTPGPGATATPYVPPVTTTPTVPANPFAPSASVCMMKVNLVEKTYTKKIPPPQVCNDQTGVFPGLKGFYISDWYYKYTSPYSNKKMAEEATKMLKKHPQYPHGGIPLAQMDAFNSLSCGKYCESYLGFDSVQCQFKSISCITKNQDHPSNKKLGRKYTICKQLYTCTKQCFAMDDEQRVMKAITAAKSKLQCKNPESNVDACDTGCAAPFGAQVSSTVESVQVDSAKNQFTVTFGCEYYRDCQ